MSVPGRKPRGGRKAARTDNLQAPLLRGEHALYGDAADDEASDDAGSIQVSSGADQTPARSLAQPASPSLSTSSPYLLQHPFPSFSSGHDVALLPGPFRPQGSVQQVAVAPADGGASPSLNDSLSGTARSISFTSLAGSGSAAASASPDEESGVGAPVETPRDWSLFSLGLRMGALLLLAFWVLWDCVVDTRLRPAKGEDAGFWIDAVLPLYRATGFTILGFWLWCLNLWVWSRAHVSHLFLMHLHPRTSSPTLKVFDGCISLTIVWLANFLVYFKMQRGDFPRFGLPNGVLPVAMCVFLAVLCCPWPFGWGSPGKQWPKALWETLCAPFARVTFLHVFVGDCLTSFVKPLNDWAYAACFLGTGLFLRDELTPDNGGSHCLHSPVLNKVITPILSALPLYLRLMQCFRRYFDTRARFPHMVNAGKYATAMCIVLVGVFHQSITKGGTGLRAAWILCLCASTLYSYTWDVTQDWDLGPKHKGQRGLRETLMYRARWKYYVAIVLDCFMRFAWALQFVPASADSPLGAWWSAGYNPLVAGVEMLRRAGWAMLRVENEHLQEIVYKAHRMDAERLTQTEHNVKHTHARDVPVGSDLVDVEDLDAELLVDGEGEFSELEQAAAREAQQPRTSGLKLLLEIALLASGVVAISLIAYFTN